MCLNDAVSCSVIWSGCLEGSEWVRSNGEMLNGWNPDRLSHCHSVHCKSINTLPLPHCPLQIHKYTPTATLSTANPEIQSHCHTVHRKSRNTRPLPHCPLQIQKYAPTATLSTTNPTRTGLELNPGLRKLLSHGAALFIFYTHILTFPQTTRPLTFVCSQQTHLFVPISKLFSRGAAVI